MNTRHDEDYNFVFKIIIALTIVCCANRGTPTGGEIDEVAPSIIKSTPENYTLNFNSKEIRVYFDEYIKFKNLQKYLIISPPIDPAPEITPLGTASKYLEIKFQDSLQPNSTYVFNFGESIVDNNADNVFSNYKYVFSTGKYIDSLKINGSLKDALERKVSEEVETARELVAQEKIGASNAFREAFRAKESALAEKDEDKKEALEEEAAKLEARAVRAQEEADVAQDVLNEETKKLHRSGNVVISSSSSTSSKSTAEAKVGLLDAATDDDDNNKEFKEILEEVEEQKDALEEKNTAAGKTKVASCKGKSPNFKVQASVAISGAGITSASQISTHPEFADSFSKTIVTLTGADEDQLMWLDLSTRPVEEEEGEKDSKSSRLGAWFSSVALGRFVSDDSNEEPVEVTFSLLSCSRSGAEDLADKLYGVTPKKMLAAATEYGAAIDDIQFVSPPKVLPVDQDFIESYSGPTVEGKSTSVNVKPRVLKTALKIVNSEKEAEMEEKGEQFEEEEERDEEKEEKNSNRSSYDESGNGSLSEQLASIQRDSLQSIQAHQKREMSVADDDDEAF